MRALGTYTLIHSYYEVINRKFHRASVFTAIAQLFREPQALKSSTDDAAAGSTEIDLEEQSAGYQAALSDLLEKCSSPTEGRDVAVEDIREWARAREDRGAFPKGILL